MNHLDLFSGIGGFALPAKWVWGEEHNIVSFVEIDKFCQKVLKKHWPDVPIIEDIRNVTYERILAYANGRRLRRKYKQCKKKSNANVKKMQGQIIKSNSESTKIDLLTGGFPCQPFSVAGKRRSTKDDRYLWPQMFRVIREVQPTWVIGENVAGIINLELDQVLSDLESASYEVQPFLIPACGVDAPHRRDRVWIIGHSNGIFRQSSGTREGKRKLANENKKRNQDVADSGSTGLKTGRKRNKPKGTKQFSGCSMEDGTIWLPEPNVGRVAYGVPNRVDRIKCLGNAVVPQIPMILMNCIKRIEDGIK